MFDLELRDVYTVESDYDRVINEYTQAIKLDPFDAASYLGRGKLFAAKKVYDCALMDYNQAIGINPVYAAAYLCRGDCHIAQKKYDKAIDDYYKALELEPDNAVFRKAKAYAYYIKGYSAYVCAEYDKALKEYECALEINQDYQLIYLGRGLNYLAKKDYVKAIDDFTKAIELDIMDKGYPAAYRHRGNAYVAMISDEEFVKKILGNGSQGIAEYREKMDNYLAKLEVAKGHIHKTVEDKLAAFKKERKTSDDSKRNAYINQILEAHQEEIEERQNKIKEKGEREKAVYKKEAMGKFEQKYGGDADMYRQDLNDFDNKVEVTVKQEMESCEKSILDEHKSDIEENDRRLQEDYERAVETEKRVLYGEEEKDIAVKARQLRDEFPLIKYFNLAVEDYVQAIAFNPTYSAAYYDRGKLYFTIGNYDKAYEDLKRAQEHNPNDPAVRSLLCKAEEAMVTQG